MVDLTNEMRKTELDMQKETYVSTALAQNKINVMYELIKGTLRYVKDVVGFMKFEVEEVEYATMDTK